MPPMCRHIAAACRKISVICRRNLTWSWKQRKVQIQRKQKKTGKRSKPQWFLSWQEIMNLSGNRRLCPKARTCRMVFEGIQRRNSVHFAAAATMLLRACGMPARYVVGYAARQVSFRDRRTAAIRLFWRMITPMLGRGLPGRNRMDRSGGDTGLCALVTESDGARARRRRKQTARTPRGKSLIRKTLRRRRRPGIGNRIFRVVKKALATVALLITVCGILAVIRRHILCKRRKRGRKGEAPGEQIQRIYRSFAALQKFNKKSVCSCQEERFAKQLGKKYPVFSEKTAQKLANIVLKACYSDQGLTKKECQFVLDCYEKLAEAVSKELSPAKRLVGSLIFCFW